MVRSSISRFKSSWVRFRRCSGSTILSSIWASSILRSRLLAIRSARRPGSSRLPAITMTSDEIALPRLTLRSSDFLVLLMRASLSSDGSSSGSAMREMRASR
jgi:hypothetical protein